MANVTIQQLDIVVNVDDDGESAFARLFDQHIRRWAAQKDLSDRLHREAEAERRVFDRKGGR
jgi:hypothetical protein